MKKIINIGQAWPFPGKIKYLLCAAVLFAIAATAQTSSIGKPEARCGFNKELMVKMNQDVIEKIKNLRVAGKLNFKNGETSKNQGALTAPVLFRWPLTTAAYRDFPSWHIGNFVDLDASVLTKNYTCNYNRTYDGHQGTDIGVDPYEWEIKNSGFVQAVAAADGIIVDKHDGEDDESCGSNFNDPPLDFLCHNYPNNQGNYVVILHNDGTTATFYMHMKKGSLTAKQEGDAISAGDYLGTVASAGCSTGPHLHFEVRKGYINSGLGLDDVTGTVVDPFVNGACAQGTDSYWIDERPYTDPAVLTLETHSSAPEKTYTSDCDKTMNLYYDNSFSANQTIWFRSELRDWIDGSTLTHNIYKPDGNVWHKYTRTNPNLWRDTIPLDQSYSASLFESAGTYRYAVTIGGKEYSHYFAIGCQTDNTLTGAATGQKGNMVSNSVTSTQTISSASTNYIKYMADGHVTLNPGFQATAGCRFVANTEGCNNSTKKYAKNSAAEVTEEQAKRTVINSVDKSKNLSVYPNPSTGVFFVRYKSEKLFNATIVVRNTFGQIVYQGQTQKNILELQQTINLAGKPKGLYFIELNTGDKKMTDKVVIQ